MTTTHQRAAAALLGAYLAWSIGWAMPAVATGNWDWVWVSQGVLPACGLLFLVINVVYDWVDGGL